MEFIDAMEEFSGSNDHSMIIKGKRTKRRQRPSSPAGRAAVTSSSSSGGDGELLGYIYCNTTTSASDMSISATHDDQEDIEDMANCLILLAQGDQSWRKQEVEHQDQDQEIKVEKFSSRKFNEMISSTSTTNGKVGFFVYECKTCNRTFPSFQALGGHRASHKKPKISTIEDNKVSIFTPSSNDHHHFHGEKDQEQEEVKKEVVLEVKKEVVLKSPPLTIQPTTNNKPCTTANNKGSSRSHECAICGAEFASGQALGGHMRRHRNSMTTNASKVAAMILETSHHQNVTTSSHDDHDQKPTRNIFPLDLNLPAPSEDADVQRDHLKFNQFSGNQQPHLVFSAPALVDCHY